MEEAEIKAYKRDVIRKFARRREKTKMSYRQAARLIEIDHAQLWRIEKGTEEASKKVVEKMNIFLHSQKR